MTADALDVEIQEKPFTPFNALLGVLIRPRRTFEQMRDAKRGYWWVAFVLALIALVIATVATVPVQAEISRAAIEAQREQLDLDAEQMAQVEQTQQLFSSAGVLGALNTVTGIIGLVINYAMRAGILFLLGLALGGQASFKQIWRMAVWTTLPLAIGDFVSAMAVIVTGQMPVQGLSFMLTSAERAAASPVVGALLTRIDLYTIWSLILIGVGMVATARLSRVKSTAIAVGYWLLGVLVAIGTSAAGQAITRGFTGG